MDAGAHYERISMFLWDTQERMENMAALVSRGGLGKVEKARDLRGGGRALQFGYVLSVSPKGSCAEVESPFKV